VHEALARICIGSLLTIGLLLTGCNPVGWASAHAADTAHPTGSAAGDSPEPPEEPPALPRAFEQSPPAPIIFVEYVVTPHDVVARMLALARVGPEDVVYDLGCGDGRILIAAAKNYGCRAVGFDLDRLRVAEARAHADREGLADRVTVEQKDVLKVDLRAAAVVTIYLSPELNRRLIPQLEQLPPGARIVSHNFGIGDFAPDQTVRMTSREDHQEHLIYLWTSPLRKTE